MVAVILLDFDIDDTVKVIRWIELKMIKEEERFFEDEDSRILLYEFWLV